MRAELGALAERAAVGLLADEADRPRLQLERDPLQPLGRAREVGAPEVAGAGGRPVRGVGDAEPELQQLELLARLVEARREARGVQEPPEVVARIREVGVRGGGDAAGVDAAEDRRQPGREDVRDVALGGFGFAGVELVFKERTEQLAGDGRLVAGAPLRRR